MLQNAYFLAKIGADTAENEQHFAENLPKIGNYPTGPSRGRAPEDERVFVVNGSQRISGKDLRYKCRCAACVDHSYLYEPEGLRGEV